jgi:hypothetical protein
MACSMYVTAGSGTVPVFPVASSPMIRQKMTRKHCFVANWISVTDLFRWSLQQSPAECMACSHCVGGRERLHQSQRYISEGFNKARRNAWHVVVVLTLESGCIRVNDIFLWSFHHNPAGNMLHRSQMRSSGPWGKLWCLGDECITSTRLRITQKDISIHHIYIAVDTSIVPSIADKQVLTIGTRTIASNHDTYMYRNARIGCATVYNSLFAGRDIAAG